MALPKQLVRAYEQAKYLVFAEPRLVLRIGEPNPGVDALLDAARVPFAAFVTPCNPRGEKQTEQENIDAFLAFEEALSKTTAYACRRGEGRGPAWGAEPSLLILGIPRREAEALGRAYRQNAIVYLMKGEAPELVVLA
jgi:hypothetical protein